MLLTVLSRISVFTGPFRLFCLFFIRRVQSILYVRRNRSVGNNLQASHSLLLLPENNTDQLGSAKKNQQEMSSLYMSIHQSDPKPFGT